jgi:DNA polymerase/3'-5' exonuclease PolX
MNEMQNLTISECLRAMADLLQAQGANPFRVSAYRKAADAVVQLAEDLAALFEREGVEGLDAIPGVGRGIASAIAEMLITGR